MGNANSDRDDVIRVGVITIIIVVVAIINLKTRAEIVTRRIALVQT